MPPPAAWFALRTCDGPLGARAPAGQAYRGTRMGNGGMSAIV